MYMLTQSTQSISQTTGLMKRLTALSLLAGLAACGAADRISGIGQAPELEPIENVKAPLRQRSISVPMPSQDKPVYEPNSLWRTGARHFFKDQRASRIGDIVTVRINIADSAQLGNTTTRSRSTAEDVGANFLGLESRIPSVIGNAVGAGTAGQADIDGAFNAGSLAGADSTSTYTGNGVVNRSEAIQIELAALVTDVLPNGNFVIEGRQEIRVNFEKREILVAGIIRPEDISSANTILNSQIAEARIVYGGKGQITDVQQPRYGTQLYDIIFPF